MCSNLFYLLRVQGINYEQIDKLQSILHDIGDLAMQGSLLIGHLSGNGIGSSDKVTFKQLHGKGVQKKRMLCFSLFIFGHKWWVIGN
jgi:hypothetical protein